LVAAVALTLAGLLMLTTAADQLIVGAGRVAQRLRVPPVLVGVVVIGLGTSAPEFVVSGIAAHRGNVPLAVGSLVGSNILNLTLILGIAALIAPIVVRSSVVRREAPLSVVAVAAFAATAAIGFGRLSGTLLASATVLALILLVRLGRTVSDQILPGEVAEFLDETCGANLVVESLRTLAGLAGTLIGAELVVSNAADIARRLGVPQLIVGFTLVALGTSLPELVTSIQAQRHGEADLLVGNLLGSNLFNSLAGGAIIGLASRSAPVTPVAFEVLAVMVLVSLVTWAVLFRGYRVSRAEGGLLLAIYVLVLPTLM
jgi:cation:H+ antiporter